MIFSLHHDDRGSSMALKWIPVIAAVLLGSCAPRPVTNLQATSIQARQMAFQTGQCFRGEEVNNFNVQDKRNAYVSTRRGYVYRLESSKDCFRENAVTVSMPQHRLSNYGNCIGEETAVASNGWRGPGSEVCTAMISGPIRDSRVSGLWSRQD